MIATRHILSGLGVLALVASAHCSSTFSDYCEKDRDCRGGNDADIDACVEELRASENVASAYDCDNQFDDLSDCIKNAFCNTTTKRLDLSACRTQSEALSNCQKAASAKK